MFANNTTVNQNDVDVSNYRSPKQPSTLSKTHDSNSNGRQPLNYRLLTSNRHLHHVTRLNMFADLTIKVKHVCRLDN